MFVFRILLQEKHYGDHLEILHWIIQQTFLFRWPILELIHGGTRGDANKTEFDAESDTLTGLNKYLCSTIKTFVHRQKTGQVRVGFARQGFHTIKEVKLQKNYFCLLMNQV